MKSSSAPAIIRNFIFYPQDDFILVIFLTLLFLVLPTISSGQKAPDSLLFAVKASNGTKKVDALNNLAEYTFRYSVKDALHLLEQAQNLSENLNYKFGKAKSFQILASLYGNKGENQKAINFAVRAAKIFSELKEHESDFNCLVIQGSNYNALGNNSKSIDYYLQALHLAEKIRRSDLQSSASALLSQNFIKLDDKANACGYASKSLLISRKSRNAPEK